MTASHATMRQLIEGYRISQMICVAAELGIADLLADGPRHYSEIAGTTRTDAPTLYRLLRALASMEVFAELDGCRFALTPLADCLRTGVAGTLRPWAIHSGRLIYDTWAHLDHSVATGDTAFDYCQGMNVWAYRESHPEDGRVFHDAMAANTTIVSRSVVDAHDFSRFGTLVDVGGGKGALIQAILTANPKLRGILFDVRAAVKEASALFAIAGLSDRCRFVTGNFFESVPEGGNAYMLSRILHDWHDDQCSQILKTMRRSMSGDSSLLIVERVLDAQSPGVEATQSDINMLVMTGGRERTAAEFKGLLETSGFALRQVIPTNSSVQIIVAMPA